jgi:cytosine/adenosine deaminase-related metal-dependent hydrolase
VGSDSHAVIDIFEEARGVEMHQRLRTGRRGVIGPAALLTAATTGGSASLGLPTPHGLSVGAAADFVVVDPASPRLAGMDLTNLDSVVFAATSADVTDTFVDGEKVVAGSQHPLWEEVKVALSAKGK